MQEMSRPAVHGSVNSSCDTMRTMQLLKPSRASVLGHSLVRPAISRRVCVRTLAQQSDEERKKYNVRKGRQFENKRRRKGREAHLRSPYDSPLRDGNRDRLIGLLTERAAKTLMIYLMETNGNVYSWLLEFYKANPIPKNGSWDEVSGEAFLRKLLSMPISEAKFNTGRDSLFDNVRSCGVDPRSIAQRIMDIRTQLSEEFIQELQAIAEENSLLLRETLTTSLSTTLTTLDGPAAAAASKDAPVHPELADSPISSSSATKDQQGSNSSSKDGPTSTPPPSPVPGAPKPKAEPIRGSSSTSSSAGSKKASDAADKAAAVASLNAALKKPTAAGSGSSSSSRPAAAGSNDSGSSDASGSSSEGKVDMTEVLAQLRRAMEADVARDVLKMKESTGGSSSTSSTGSSGSSVTSSSIADAPSSPASTAGDSSSAGGLTPTAAEAAAVTDDSPPAAADFPAPTPAAAASVGNTDNTAEDSPAAVVEESPAPISTAAASQLPTGSAVVGEAGTYSLMLPKGWGPRLGVGFSKYPRSRNNIVSSANLGSLSPKAGQTAGDAFSGAAGEAV